MKRLSSPIRRRLAFGAVLASACSLLSAQVPQSYPVKPSAAVSALPAAQPTGTPGQADATPKAAPATHRVDVQYADGQLEVETTNGSLNEILREISRKTGMKITGGVADDRVFGNYGPASPAIVLNALLEGTGSNVLLIDGAKDGIGSGTKDGASRGSELILTPRHGGVTPPNPNAAQTPSNESEDSAGQYVPPVRPFQPPVAGGRGSIPANVDPQISAPGGGDSSDPNGQKTPQQIYDQLQRAMQQQKQAPNAPPQ